jgi:hypothetical protein
MMRFLLLKLTNYARPMRQHYGKPGKSLGKNATRRFGIERPRSVLPSSSFGVS